MADTANAEAIRDAYRRLAKRWHPDRCPGDPEATPRFRAINAAYEAAVRKARAEPETIERVLWRASRDVETILLTTTRLLQRRGEHRQQVALRDIRCVAVHPLPRSGDAELVIRTATAAHSIALPHLLSLRLAELLTARAP